MPEDHQTSTPLSPDARGVFAEAGPRGQAEGLGAHWLRETLASLPDAVIHADLEGRVVCMNAAGESLLGVRPGGWEGRGLDEVLTLVQEEGRGAMRSPTARVLMGEDRAALPEGATVVRGDGEARLVKGAASALRGAEGALRGVSLVMRDATEEIRRERTLRRSEEELRESEQRVRLAADAAELGVWVWDVDLDVVTWLNDRPYEQFGIAKGSGPINAAQFRSQFLHPEDAGAFDASVRAAFAPGGRFEFLGRIVRPGGEVRWIEFKGRLIAGPDGPTRRLHGTSVDVTERRAAEGALDQSRRDLARVNDELRGRVEELQTLLNVLPAGVFVAHDPACSSITCNPAGAAMLGVPHGINCSKTGPDAAQLPFRVLKGGVEVAPGELPIQRAARTGQHVVGAEFEVLRADGTTVVLYQYAAPLFDPEGKVRGCLGVMVDISARLEVERKLADSRARAERQRRVYEAILTNTPDLAYVWDLNHRFIYANDGLLKMWGKRWEEAIGRNCLELGYEPWHAAMHDREIEQVVATRQPLRGEVPFSGSLGRRVYDYILVPVLGENGEVEAVAGTTRDVTDRKNVEEQRERVLASERLARLTAERAGKLKEEFLATLSHELRTPLNAMLGWIQILRKRPPTPELLEQGLAVIHRNASAQSRLIGDLLDMSRIISGKVRMEVQKVELPPVIEAALEAARPAAEAKGVVLERVIEALEVPVLGDATRLQQVFWNLLSNAVKFTPRGGRVRVVLAAGAEHVDFSVTDTGQGIHPDFLPHVFERFRQADSSASRSHGGLGLGLAIVKQLVELHGGSVHAASAGEGRGATFTVRLPLGVPRRPRVEAAPSRQEGPASGVAAGLPRLDGVRVLVVDDEADARMLVRYLLEECGAQVLLASSTDEALALARKSTPHVVLSDIGMPQRDGYELVSTLRREGFRVPAAAVSAFVREEDRARAISAGYQMHLAKPVQPEELLAAVVSLAGRAAGPGEGGTA